jgi:hypothetical protein
MIPTALFAEGSKITADIKTSAKGIAEALKSSGYKADFTIESLKELDRFFDEHTECGKAKPGGLLEKRTAIKIFSISSYVGEVLRKKYGGEWIWMGSDSDVEMRLELRLKDGVGLLPTQKVMKRFRNGDEDSLYLYGIAAGKIQKE